MSSQGRMMSSQVANFNRRQNNLKVSDPCYFPKWRLDYRTWERYSYRWRVLFSSKQKVFEVFFSVLYQNQIHKCQMLQGFLAFLLQLLYRSTHSILNNLEKELRFLLTILGDVSWMLVDSGEHNFRFQDLVAGFEEVSNQAGCFLYSFFLESDLESLFRVLKRGVKFQVVEELSAVLNNIDLLKATIQSFELITTPETPRTSIVNSFIFLDSLVNDLRDLLRGEDTRIVDVKDLIKLLHQGLSPLHSSISDRRLPQPSQNIGQLKEPLMRRIGDIAHQAQYLISAFLVNDAPLWYVKNRLTFLNDKIQHIRRELQVITENYESQGLRVNAQRPLLEERENDSNELLVGFEDEARDILDQLVGEGRQTRLVISIIGMPGIGKTTLAKKLYNHPSVRDRFDKLSWLVVSQNFERQSILTAILIHINNDLDKNVILNMEEETSVEHIHKTLKGRRYLIVMDDVWDSSVWDELQRCLPDDGNGSRILLTSRNKSVARPNSINHELPFLLDEQCWELLEKEVFGRRSCPPQLQPIGKKIAAKCCGLPLTVVVIAGVLSTVDEEESAWEEVGGSLDSLSLMKNDEDNTVMQILELSYKHLPVHLKPCFLFLGAYKEDEEVRVEKLKRLWIAEGFIREEFEKSKENVAEEYLMELIDKSLVMVARKSWDGRRVKACVVHDLLRDLCLKISQGESFLQYLDKFNSISVGRHCARVLGSCILDQHVRSFYCDDWTASMYVRDMRLLRTLHFFRDNWRDSCHLFGVEYLVNLRSLVIGEIPTCFEKLINLEYLSLRTLKTVYLPPSMKKLRYIDASKIEYDQGWSSTCESNNLEYLSWIIVKTQRDEKLLKCSPHLRKLKCRYFVEERNRPHFDLRSLTQLHSLSLTFPGFELKEFGFPSNIRKLTLSWASLSWEKMSIIGRLENLEILKLCESATEGETWDTGDGEFQKLRYLKLEGAELSQWNVTSDEHFPELQRLILRNCFRLVEIPTEFCERTTLELIEVTGKCLNSLRESAERIQEEQRQMGNEELKVITG